jgi:hypothetical protein
MLAHSWPRGGTAEAIKPRAIAILFLIASNLFTFGKSSSPTESQQLKVIPHPRCWRELAVQMMRRTAALLAHTILC